MVIVGIDEVGRGCWAGPLVAGAVILRKPINGLKDSKKLSRNQREKLTVTINREALAVGLGWVSSLEIDAIGLTRATKLAMQRALDQINMNFDKIIIDGNLNFFPNDPRASAVIKADASEPSVSAASIVAKVARDNWMITEAVKQYPEYQFEKHVGYGTKLHKSMLEQYGISELHRKSYKPIQKLVISSSVV